MRQLEILDVKVIDALPEYLGLVIGFNSKTQLCMQRSQALVQRLENILIGWRRLVTRVVD